MPETFMKGKDPPLPFFVKGWKGIRGWCSGLQQPRFAGLIHSHAALVNPAWLPSKRMSKQLFFLKGKARFMSRLSE